MPHPVALSSSHTVTGRPRAKARSSALTGAALLSSLLAVKPAAGAPSFASSTSCPVPLRLPPLRPAPDASQPPAAAQTRAAELSIAASSCTLEPMAPLSASARSATPPPRKATSQGLTVKENASVNNLDRRARGGVVPSQEVHNMEVAANTAKDSTPRSTSWRQRMCRAVGMLAIAVAVVGAGVVATPQFDHDAAQQFFGNATLQGVASQASTVAMESLQVAGDVASSFFGESLLFCCMAGGAIAEATKIILRDATHYLHPFFDAFLKQLVAYDTHRYLDMVGYFDGVGYFHASFPLYYCALGAFGVAVVLAVQAHLYAKAKRV